MKTTPLLLLLAFVGLSGCAHLPRAPERADELNRQCAYYAYKQSLKLNDLVDGTGNPEEINDVAQQLVWSTEAVSDWVGKPEKKHKGDVRKLVVKMDDSDTEYRKELSGWKNEVSRFGGGDLGGSGWFGKIITLSIIAGAIYLFLKLKAFIPWP